ncbi:hypothetical protein IJ095_02555 [Candidatus Saccharibacteria bacterium]|nr:hypothetical protein [Candidatus Saccharibacteria bacterium]
MDEIKKPDLVKWRRNAIPTSCGLLVAPEDYFEGEINLFSFKEVENIARMQRMLGTGWRPMSAQELLRLFVTYGMNERLDRRDEMFESFLGLTRNGEYAELYWTATAFNQELALGYQGLGDISGMYPNIHARPRSCYGHLRMVRDNPRYGKAR